MSRFNPSVLAILLIVLGCKIAEPEPIQGTTARGLPLEPVTIGGLVWAQHVNGIIRVALPVDLRASDVVGYSLGFDDEVITPLMAPEAEVDLNLTLVPDGQHRIVFFVFTSVPYEGMLGLLGAPRRSYYSIITVDHTISILPPLSPPAAPTNVRLTWVETPQLTWDATVDTNVSGYVIQRMISGVPPAVTLATNLGPSATTFVDLNISKLYGASVTYTVGSSNRTATTFAPPVTTQKGTILAVPSADEAVRHPSGSFVIMLSEGWTRASTVSLSTYAVERSTALPIRGGDRGGWTVAEDGATMYAGWISLDASTHDTVHSITAYSIPAFAQLRDLHLPFRMAYPIGVVAGHAERLYVCDNRRVLWVVNGATGVVEDSALVPDGLVPREMAMADGRDWLFLTAYDREMGGKQLLKYDVRAAKPLLAVRSSSLSQVLTIQWNRSGNRLVVVHDNGQISVVDAATLAVITTIERPTFMRSGTTYSAIDVLESSVVVGYSESSGGSVILQFNTSTGGLERGWQTLNAPRVVFRISSTGALLAGGISSDPTHTWIIGPNE